MSNTREKFEKSLLNTAFQLINAALDGRPLQLGQINFVVRVYSTFKAIVNPEINATDPRTKELKLLENKLTTWATTILDEYEVDGDSSIPTGYLTAVMRIFIITSPTYPYSTDEDEEVQIYAQSVSSTSRSRKKT